MRQVIAFVIVFLLAAPALAQDAALPEDVVLVPEWVIILATVFFALLVILLGGSILALYRSMPPLAQGMFQAVLPPLVGLLEKQVEQTKTRLDDIALDEIEKFLRRGEILEPEEPDPATPGKTTREKSLSEYPGKAAETR